MSVLGPMKVSKGYTRFALVLSLVLLAGGLISGRGDLAIIGLAFGIAG